MKTPLECYTMCSFYIHLGVVPDVDVEWPLYYSPMRGDRLLDSHGHLIWTGGTHDVEGRAIWPETPAPAPSR